MYVVDSLSPNNIRSCPVPGSLTSCVDSGATGIGSTANTNLGLTGMAIYPPTSQLFITDAVADKVYACTQNNGLLSGCIDSGATGLSGPRDIVFVGNTAIKPRRANRPCPISRRLGVPIMPVSPTE